VADRNHNGRPSRMPTVIDEQARECLATRAGRRRMAKDVGAHLTELFWSRDVPGHIRSYQRLVFTSRRIRRWLSKLGTRTLFIEPMSPGGTDAPKASREAAGRALEAGDPRHAAGSRGAGRAMERRAYPQAVTPARWTLAHQRLRRVWLPGWGIHETLDADGGCGVAAHRHIAFLHVTSHHHWAYA
jgi:hypothetical protein